MPDELSREREESRSGLDHTSAVAMRDPAKLCSLDQISATSANQRWQAAIVGEPIAGKWAKRIAN
jgi:hypothetical protein